MKQKPIAAPKERNQFVAAALFRKAGAHQKTHKALRRTQKMRDRGVNGLAQQTLNLSGQGSNPCGPTITI